MTKTGGTTGSTVDRNGITHRKGVAKVKDSQSKDYQDPFEGDNQNIPYSKEKYDEAKEYWFNNPSSILNQEIRKPYAYAKDEVLVNSSEFDFSTKKIGRDKALEFFKGNFSLFIQPIVEHEGFTTTNYEIIEMWETDDLEDLKDAEKSGERIATVAGVVEGHKKVVKAIEQNRDLDYDFICDLNSSFAAATVKKLAGCVRGTKSPGVTVHIALAPNGTFIPPVPEYGGKNLIDSLKKDIDKVNSSNSLQDILAFDSAALYNQYFYDGNTRTSAYFTYAKLIQNGYRPFLFDDGVRAYKNTKRHLIATGDATPRIKYLLENMEEL